MQVLEIAATENADTEKCWCRNLQILKIAVLEFASTGKYKYSTSSIIRSSRDSISSKPERISKKTG